MKKRQHGCLDFLSSPPSFSLSPNPPFPPCRRSLLPTFPTFLLSTVVLFPLLFPLSLSWGQEPKDFNRSPSTVLKASAPPTPNPKWTSQIPIAIFDIDPKTKFEHEVEPLIRSVLNACKKCLPQNYTPYDEKGEVDMKNLSTQIEIAAEKSALIYFHSNLKLTEDLKPLVTVLQKTTEKGTLVVASTGFYRPPQQGAPLKKTLLGQNPSILLIGELTEKERLFPESYFGPEILTAIKPPREWMGQKVSPLIFLSQLAQNLHRKPPKEWVNSLKNRKLTSHRLWPALEELFR